MSVSDYFALCLGDPEHGYYKTREPFGVAGDFTTAPEISQLFGEIIGIFLVLAWQSHGKPAPVRLIEIGPGRGTLMADIQRVVSSLAPDLARTATAHLVETSEHLSAIQKKTLGGPAIATSWHTHVDDVPAGFTLLVSNELFDAIPIRQFVMTDEGLRERVIAIGEGNKLAFQAGTATIDAPKWAKKAKSGDILEMAPAREALMARIAERIVNNGGIALTIDYGHTRSALGDTLQAVSRHRFADVLANPGECDLTSHVDFEALGAAAHAEGAHIWPVMGQGEFLLALGLLERAGTLGANKSVETQQLIRQSVERLAGDGDNQMGNLFKVLCIAGSPASIAPFATGNG
ncbi:class I SAM-dependent methyltransferase [Hoeflea sp. TYP-13]|uniref:class I SAM-dependent methyltransferase n=1 Tax=Hoeflea sp. TYP-13 TaxID=3230023 RepID=UPI0034C603A1